VGGRVVALWMAGTVAVGAAVASGRGPAPMVGAVAESAIAQRDKKDARPEAASKRFEGAGARSADKPGKGRGRGGGVGPREVEGDPPEPGLLAMWSDSVPHARLLGQVDWSGQDRLTVEAAVNWPSTTEPFCAEGPSDYFAVRLVGRIAIAEGGVWFFHLSSDDGARLYIDGALVVDDEARHSMRRRSGMVSLSAGAHDIEVRFLEVTGSQGLVLEWQGPSDAAREVVPAGALSHVPAEAPADDPEWGLRAYWFPGAAHASRLGQMDWTAYSSSTIERNVSWEITSEPFTAGGPTDYFALRLVGTIEIPQGGDWVFQVGSDAGARLLIDGRVVIDDDADHGFRFRSGTAALARGEHAIELRYLERNGSQGLVATWEGPGEHYQEVIPPSALRPREAGDPAEVGGLNAYWTNAASHASSLGQIDWDRYDTRTAVGRVYWPITSGAFTAGGPADYFAVRLYGQIVIPEDGAWTFNLGSDAGAQLLVDGRYVVSDDANHGFRFRAGSVDLLAGVHAFEVRYLERNGSNGLVATWRGPGDTSESVIPTSALIPAALAPAASEDSGLGLRVYWTDDARHAAALGQVDWTREGASSVVERLYWPTTNGAFRAGGPTDYFALRATGKIVIPAAGAWRFGLGSDEGARLLVDGRLLVQDEASHGFRFRFGSIDLSAGEHDFEVLYLERNGSQGLVATWRGPGMPSEQVIPASALRVGEPAEAVAGGMLRAYWTAGASHADRIGRVDWSNYTGMSTVEKVYWPITTSAFAAGGPEDYFALRAVGRITIPRGGEWTFKVGSDAGARLYIDGRLVVDDDAIHGFRIRPGGVSLAEGVHDFDLRYLERNSSQGLVATWRGPGDAYESVIPSSAFALSDAEPVVDAGGGGLRAYWTPCASHAALLGQVDWSDYVTTAVVPKIAWEITSAPFYTGGDLDYFAGRFVGTIAIPEAGEWTFALGSDAGGAMFIDGSPVVYDDANHGFRFQSGKVVLGRGEHDIEIRYLERNSSQGLVATWDGPGERVEEVIPGSALRPAALESPGGSLAGTGPVRAEWFERVYDSSLATIDWSEPTAETAVDKVAWRITRWPFYEGGGADYFALRATGTLAIAEGGLWSFKIGSDAGAELYIDGALVVRDDANHGFRYRSGTAFLEAGTVDFEVRYLERNSSQGLVVTWRGPGETYESVIPTSAFVAPGGERRRVVRWRGTDQRETLRAAVAAEVVRRGGREDLEALRAAGRDTIANMLAVIGCSSVREALGDDAAVLQNLASHPAGD
jgi:hypothetical protein